MVYDPPIAFREFVMAEGLTLATIHGAVLDHLRGRNDAAIFGAQAVNAYVDIQRMTQDVDILSHRAEAFSQELCEQLHARFYIAVRVRTVASGAGYRIYQVRSPTNRHFEPFRKLNIRPRSGTDRSLSPRAAGERGRVRGFPEKLVVDVRHVSVLPTCQRIEGILVVAPVELLAMKVISMAARPKTPKGLTDEADLLRLLQKFPDLKKSTGPVFDALQRHGASDQGLQVWRELVEQEITSEDDDDY